MFRLVFIITFVIFFHLLRTECFNFEIKKNISSTESLNNTEWSYVSVTNEKNDTVSVKVDIPINLNYSEIFVFFANDAKEILRVKLKDEVEGTLYKSPYNKDKEMTSEKVTKFKKEPFLEVSGNFPKEWLPSNSSKISATVVTFEEYFNYYGIQNLKISFPDLMVVEEFKNYTLN